MTQTWSGDASAAIPRTYHSSAVLLPDARVFVGGSGLCGGCAVNHLDAEIFSPNYLFNPDGSPAARPTITVSAGSVGTFLWLALDTKCACCLGRMIDKVFGKG